MKIILSTICLALLALFTYQVMTFSLAANEISHSNTLNPAIPKSIDYKLPQLAVLNSIDKYSVIVNRPLFDKSRAPEKNVATGNRVTTVNELAHLILVGTARSTDVQIGIVADTKAKQMERLKVGETYHDWEIAEVSTDFVLFKNADTEYKLFITPIEGSAKAKQARLISQLNKSKIDRAAAAIHSYKANNIKAENTTDSKRSVTGRSWGYNKKYNQNNKIPNDSDNQKENSEKSVQRSPIKIPVEEDEHNAAYYEGLDEDDEAGLKTNKSEMSAEDFYGEGEDITEDQLKALEALGAQIFDD
jgi:hypothetical protein